VSLRVVTSLRITKAAMISNTPMTTSQMPTTRVNIAIESTGHARTTMPAITAITPKKIPD